MPPQQSNIYDSIWNLVNQIGQENSVGNQAAATAIQYGANPAVVDRARQSLGLNDFIGWCESFVEQVSGVGWRGTTATDAWNRTGTRIQGLRDIAPGDAVYFRDPVNPNGHTGIYVGNNQFISATNSGIRQMDIGQWMKSTGQRLLGYIPAAESAIESVAKRFMQPDSQKTQGQQTKQQSVQNISLPSVSYRVPDIPVPQPKAPAVPTPPAVSPYSLANQQQQTGQTAGQSAYRTSY